ncbi:hypothetical protein [Streptomyces sp. YS-3]|uniref:hypothetical protein n=1 Tax=Streptomyces sp. YS-3 TaxID=3381352 RepID=UPI003862CF85
MGHVLDQVLADRVARARALDPLFAADIAERVARFSRGGGRTRSQLLWWSLRACGGADGAPVAAALRIGAALELLQTSGRRLGALLHSVAGAGGGGGTGGAGGDGPGTGRPGLVECRTEPLECRSERARS